jgi:hypothetical protein
VGLAVWIVEVSVVTALVTSGLPGLVLVGLGLAEIAGAELTRIGQGGLGWD